MTPIYKLVKAKAIITGTGNEPIQDGWMLIKSGRIKQIGPKASIAAVPAETEIIDLSNYYLLPGLIDAHTHLSIVPGEGDQLAQLRLPAATNILRSMPNIKKDLKSGVTTIRVMGEEHYIDMKIREAITKKLIPGPRILAAGVGLVATNGHGVGLTTADGEDEIRKYSRQNIAKGADLLKIFVTGGVSSTNGGLDFCSYTAQEIATAVEEADRAGKYVSAHAHGGKGVDLCLQEGVRSIEHGVFITDSQLEQIIKHDRWIVGTFSILFHPTGIEQSDFKVPAIKEKVLRAREIAQENFNKIIKSGANIALGTDSMHGLISYEMECLVNFGATNEQAIQAVTKNAATLCGLEGEIGSLEEGKIADFIAVSQHPLKKIGALKKVDYIFKNGEQVDTSWRNIPLSGLIFRAKGWPFIFPAVRPDSG